MNGLKRHTALKVSLVAQVLIEAAFFKHRSLQGHTFENLVDKLENAHASTRPILRFPGMDAQLSVRSNLIVPVLQIFGKTKPLIHGSDSMQDMLMAGHILLTDQQLQIPENALPKALLMTVSKNVEENPGKMRLGDICQLHPEIDHLPVNWSATSSSPDYRTNSTGITFVTHRFDFISVTMPWSRVRKKVEAELSKDSPRLKLTRKRNAR